MPEPIKSLSSDYRIGMTINDVKSNNNLKTSVFNTIDTNKDGQISEEEFLLYRQLESNNKTVESKILNGAAIGTLATGVVALKVGMLVATAPAWVPYVGVGLIIGSFGLYYASLFKEKQADNINKEIEENANR